MKRALLGTYTYAEFGACLGAWLPVLAASRILHRRDAVPRFPGRALRQMARVTGRLTPLWKFEVRGEPPADIDRCAYVAVSNHESSADPFLLSWLPWDMRWVAKAELFRIPFTGWALSLSGDIPLRRGESASIREMLAECRRTLEAGLSVMMFPEGTRSADGSLGRFKDGAFSLAIEAGVPVLPLALTGTRECRPKGSLWFGEANAVVRILEPIPTRGMTLADVPRLREDARDRIAVAVADLKAERAGARDA
jgi:1-acyl-sn-glycerol-3-phosphate acyltransferase